MVLGVLRNKSERERRVLGINGLEAFYGMVKHRGRRGGETTWLEQGSALSIDIISFPGIVHTIVGFYSNIPVLIVIQRSSKYLNPNSRSLAGRDTKS